MLNRHRLQSYRSQTYRSLLSNCIRTKEEAVNFVKERGFIFFWPIKGILLPSLWVAVAGDRPVADNHDDPGHITWNWKDSSLGGHDWYYAKILRKKATLISLDVVPYFYALSESYGDPEEDYIALYKRGSLTQEAKLVYEAILHQGAMDTIELKRVTRMTGRGSASRFDKALVDLQADFKIVPVKVTQAGGWRYAFCYDLVFRHYPEIVEKARFISERQARLKLIELYFRSVGAATIQDVLRIFQWEFHHVNQAIQTLVEKGILVQAKPCDQEHHQSQWIAIRDLVENTP